jgi:hypothetical protein
MVLMAEKVMPAVNAGQSEAPNVSRFEAFRGAAGAGMTTDEIMAMTRGED